MRFVYQSAFALAVSTAAFWQSALAQSNHSRQIAAASNANIPAQMSAPAGARANPNAPKPTATELKSAIEQGGKNGALPASASEAAHLIGVDGLYEKLVAEQNRARNQATDAESPEAMRQRQRIVYLHVKINAFVESASAEIRDFISELDAEVSRVKDLRAMIANQRARVQHRTSFVNLVSGGVTKIGGYSSALTPASLIPTNVLEVFDGAVQTGLSAFLLRQQHQEKEQSKVSPPVLVSILAPGDQTPEGLPPTIWAFLNNPAPGDPEHKSRRQILVESWMRMGRVVRNKPVAGQPPNTVPVLRFSESAQGDVDVVLAMDADIKALMVGLNSGLFEFTRTLKSSFADDPEI